MTAAIANRDYYLILDKSGSMKERDTPTGKSRWEYVRESTIAIAQKCLELDPDGISIYVFDNGHTAIHDVDSTDKVNEIFDTYPPGGGTNLSGVLRSCFRHYRRDGRGKDDVTGATFVVITDGVPNDQDAVVERITKCSNRALDEREFAVTFIQVGCDVGATEYLKRLDDDLQKQGARYDIVDTKTNDEVEEVGLTQALVDAIFD